MGSQPDTRPVRGVEGEYTLRLILVERSCFHRSEFSRNGLAISASQCVLLTAFSYNQQFQGLGIRLMRTDVPRRNTSPQMQYGLHDVELATRKWPRCYSIP